ncbi:MAG: OB-fold putative lipoprotein [Draconibacterium sp.]|nr:OB-fold putative lipoprotein [Draconibacterium sp.]
MKSKKFIKITAIVALAGVLIGGGMGLYMFNMPHRNVQKTEADYVLTSSQIVKEYLTDRKVANQKYLAADGDSKILEINGVVAKISEDFNGNRVILIKGENDKAGVSATFTTETNASASKIHTGDKVAVKGVIRSGAAYDDDLELYENVVLEKSSIVNN